MTAEANAVPTSNKSRSTAAIRIVSSLAHTCSPSRGLALLGEQAFRSTEFIRTSCCVIELCLHPNSSRVAASLIVSYKLSDILVTKAEGRTRPREPFVSAPARICSLTTITARARTEATGHCRCLVLHMGRAVSRCTTLDIRGRRVQFV
jgi:hypothetical protein